MDLSELSTPSLMSSVVSIFAQANGLLAVACSEVEWIRS